MALLAALAAESVGGESLRDAISKTAPDATLVVLGATSGQRSSIDICDFIGLEDGRLVNYVSHADPSPIGLDLQLLVELAATKALVIDPGMTADWTRIDEVPAGLPDRTLSGKAVSRSDEQCMEGTVQPSEGSCRPSPFHGGNYRVRSMKSLTAAANSLG
ncbi:hypothetical protein [Kribbella pratensis]|uniref:hypothetical protein n=1 Tax=Kribbella pratensis TaxID=2512112 RepID=UPI001066F459|nr:hypothetical protein [Kribbella pratensis]